MDFDLDALFIATNAPGLSAFNRVERRMAPLSKALAGVILPHNHFGSHLSSQGETTDLNLEKQNFQKAGEILAEIWSEYSIDGHDVHAQYVPPVAKRGRPAALKVAPEAFVANHCIQSTYCLQIVKCKNSSCCKPCRSNYVMRLPRFLPKPAPLVYKESGPAIDLSQAENPTNEAFFPKSYFLAERLASTSINISDFKIPPYDFFCPSAKGKLLERHCLQCNYNAPTAAALRRHDSIHTGVRVEPDEEQEEDNEEVSYAPIIENLTQWLMGSFSDC